MSIFTHRHQMVAWGWLSVNCLRNPSLGQRSHSRYGQGIPHAGLLIPACWLEHHHYCLEYLVNYDCLSVTIKVMHHNEICKIQKQPEVKNSIYNTQRKAAWKATMWALVAKGDPDTKYHSLMTLVCRINTEITILKT